MSGSAAPRATWPESCTGWARQRKTERLPAGSTMTGIFLPGAVSRPRPAAHSRRGHARLREALISANAGLHDMQLNLRCPVQAAGVGAGDQVECAVQVAECPLAV